MGQESGGGAGKVRNPSLKAQAERDIFCNHKEIDLCSSDATGPDRHFLLVPSS